MFAPILPIIIIMKKVPGLILKPNIRILHRLFNFFFLESSKFFPFRNFRQECPQLYHLWNFSTPFRIVKCFVHVARHIWFHPNLRIVDERHAFGKYRAIRPWYHPQKHAKWFAAYWAVHRARGCLTGTGCRQLRLWKVGCSKWQVGVAILRKERANWYSDEEND